MKQSVYKIPGGKMVRIFLEEKDGLIGKIKITGDFFLYPEEGIQILEKGLENIQINDVVGKIKEIADKNKLQLFGLSPEGIYEAIKIAK
jgi:lipoate-protein ligase A